MPAETWVTNITVELPGQPDRVPADLRAGGRQLRATQTSEHAAATAAALERLLPRYLDPEAVAIVQGGPEETLDRANLLTLTAPEMTF